MAMNEAERLGKNAQDAHAEANRRGNLGLALLAQAAAWEEYALELDGLARIASDAGGVIAPSRTSAEINRATKFAFDSGEILPY